MEGAMASPAHTNQFPLTICPFPYSYWDSAYDEDVMEQRVGLNLLYAQVRGVLL